MNWFRKSESVRDLYKQHYKSGDTLEQEECRRTIIMWKKDLEYAFSRGMLYKRKTVWWMNEGIKQCVFEHFLKEDGVTITKIDGSDDVEIKYTPPKEG